jgi:hypothetical protein
MVTLTPMKSKMECVHKYQPMKVLKKRTKLLYGENKSGVTKITNPSKFSIKEQNFTTKTKMG